VKVWNFSILSAKAWLMIAQVLGFISRKIFVIQIFTVKIY